MAADTQGKLALSSPAVGLLAVLAFSGSVALLTIGKQKILSHVRAAGDAASAPSLDAETPSLSECAAPQDLKGSSRDEKMQRPVVKKVRFALEVVEPTGDGRVYRSKVYNMNAKKDKQTHSEKCQRNQAASSSCLSEFGSQQVGKARGVAEPKLPANRMVLYKGMQSYRSMMMLNCT